MVERYIADYKYQKIKNYIFGLNYPKNNDIGENLLLYLI